MSHCLSTDFRVVIPAFNAEASLEELLQKIFDLMPPQQILVIDDGSSDRTAEIAIRNGVSIIKHRKNYGKGAALKSAFEYIIDQTSAQAAITVDSDGQHLPQEIHSFISEFEKTQTDLIIGARSFSYKLMPLFRLVSNSLTSRLLTLKVGQRIEDSQCGFRLYSRKLMQQIKIETKGYCAESEIIIKTLNLNLKLRFIPVSTVYNGSISYINGLHEVTQFLKLLLR